MIMYRICFRCVVASFQLSSRGQITCMDRISILRRCVVCCWTLSIHVSEYSVADNLHVCILYKEKDVLLDVRAAISSL